MKVFTYFFVLLILFTTNSLPQERDSLIQLYPGMGNTLDFIDREIFGLYKDVDGFQDAQLFTRNDKFLVSKISFTENGLFKDTVTIDDISELSNIKYQIGQFKIDNDKKIESPTKISILSNTGNNYDGKLKMFNKSHLYFISNTNNWASVLSQFNYKISTQEINSLKVYQKPSFLPYIGWGALGGTLLGLVFGFALIEDVSYVNKSNEAIIYASAGALVGALIGLIVGISVADDIITFKFKTPNDILKLKDYSAYYYQRNPSVEEQYVEIR